MRNVVLLQPQRIPLRSNRDAGGDCDCRPYVVPLAQAPLARRGASHLPQHRTDVSRRAGLLRKHYVLSEDGATAGGVYFWKSRTEAEAMYTPSWRSFVKAKYGTDPTVTYFESPVVVDNDAQKIFTDDEADR